MKKSDLTCCCASPVHLRYIAALRGIVTAQSMAPFSYLQLGEFDADSLLRLAIANENGEFYGLISNKACLETMQLRIRECNVTNIHVSDNENDFAPSCEAHGSRYDFICYSSEKTVNEGTRAKIIALARNKLNFGGIFYFKYKAYKTQKDLLQFVTQKFSDELKTNQLISFFKELSILGERYFAQDTASYSALNKAIEDCEAPSFLRYITIEQTPQSDSIATNLAMTSNGFAFVGDANIPTNYSELETSSQTQELLAKRQHHIFYEALKDFLLARLIRQDVWVHMPAQQSDDMPTLFNPFTFGITSPLEKVPKIIKTKGGTIIDLQQPLFAALINLMAKLPIGVGDFAASPEGKQFSDDEILASIQILVALGIAQPMKGRYNLDIAGVPKIEPTQTVRRYMKDLPFTETVEIASPVKGDALTLSLREAVVLKAICDVGAVHSAGAVFQELTQMAANQPSLAAQLMDSTQPTTDMADTIVKQVITQDATRWYAYGLMAA